jgi:TonB family protein
VPRRTNHVEPHYPAAALESRTQGTVRIEVTIARDGRVADARVIESVRGLDDAALAAVRRWEFASTYVGGTPVPVLHVVDVDFTPPARPTVPGPGSVQPPAQQPSSAQVRESGSPAARKPATETLIPPLRGATPIKPDPAAGPAGVREALRRYEAAWESRDAAALARVQQLSGDEHARVRATMTGAVEYGMEIAVQSIQLEPDGRRATAVCSIARRFRPRIGGKAEQRTATNTLTLERRGDAWIIVGIR